jgi:hypothetical protein
MSCGRTYTITRCPACKGTGKQKGVMAKAGSRAAVARRKLAACTRCNAYGYVTSASRLRYGPSVTVDLR